jgi:hypothetical protein
MFDTTLERNRDILTELPLKSSPLISPKSSTTSAEPRVPCFGVLLRFAII